MIRTANQPTIRYTIVPCSLGRLLLAATPCGVCAVSLGDRDGELLNFLHNECPDREIIRDAEGLRGWANATVRLLDGKPLRRTMLIDVRATPFQQRVWQALCKIPLGRTRSYREIAATLGQPTAARAVARACATNPIAVIVPCHRVIRADGGISGYRWGVQRKQAILEREKQQSIR